MTREEAKTILKNAAWLGTHEDRDKVEQALEMAIQALSQEPCELLIIKSDIFLHQDDRKKWMERIKREKENGVIILPPYFEPLLVPNDIEISIEQKSGKWIKDECGNVVCSECKRFRRDCRYGHTNYCNHCGAEMVEPQEAVDRLVKDLVKESEDKE